MGLLRFLKFLGPSEENCNLQSLMITLYIQAYKPFADPVPPNTKHYQFILTKYQPVLSYIDPVPSSTTYNSLSGKAQFSQLKNFSFYDSFDD